jgi:superfamily II DNA/RNA helicase
MTELPTVLAALADFPAAPLPAAKFKENCLERLRRALGQLASDPGAVGSGDLAGLVGHAVWRAAALGNRQSFPVPATAPWPAEAEWQAAGLRVTSRPGGWLLDPGEPWTPDWLGPSDRPPLTNVIAEVPRRADDGPAIDPCWRAALGPRLARFTSPGQRSALRAAAFARPGSTLVVNLPTGSGKSLVGWGPALLGLPGRGVTLVIVPTVALGLDQERQVRGLLAGSGLGDPDAPLAWHGDLGDDDRRAIKMAIRAGTQTVVFASPEAASTSLAPAVFDAARAGSLRGFVVDEAHTVAQWGNEFRPDFQAIAGVRRELLGQCPATNRFRTRLLSATLTQESFDTLRQLFGPSPDLGPDGFRSVAAVHLRPEPEYWVVKATDDEQKRWVLEAVRRVPRPFLLYVSRRRQAETWCDLLRAAGMRRADFVHGRSGDRAGVLDRWRANHLDAVVATSAFGLGMDKGDVRAVIHACAPETVDRFYQEVGRGGRDGRASLALTVYTEADLMDAKKLNRERIISVARGLERWDAMRARTGSVPNRPQDVVRVDLRARPADVTEDSEANVAWNLRTLTLMARAGLVGLESEPPPDLDPEPAETPEAFDSRARGEFEDYFSRAVVELRDGHRNKDVWESRIQAERARTRAGNQDQLASVRELLAGEREFGEAFAEAYRLTADGQEICPDPVCGSCPVCRARGDVRPLEGLPEPTVRTLPTLDVEPRLRTALQLAAGESLRVVTYRRPGFALRDRRRWRDQVLRELFPRLAALGVREFAVGPAWATEKRYENLYRHTPDRYLVHSDPAGTSELSVGRVTLIDPADPPPVVPRSVLRLRRPLHLVLVPTDAREPDRPADPYTDRNPTLRFDAVLAELTR